MSPRSDAARTRVAWIDASGGISGDMLLGACLDAGAPLAAVQASIDALRLPLDIHLSVEEVRRAGFRATHAHVSFESDDHARHLDEITAMLESAGLPTAALERAVATFTRLAEAEATVHGAAREDVHFHEVGALDSIADIVGTIAAFDALGVDRIVCGPISLGGGTVESSHGTLAIPGPAVLELLKESEAVVQGGPVAMELATPTGVVLALTLADEFSPLPELTISTVGVGAGTRDRPDHANVCRLVIGESVARVDPLSPPMTVIESNIDDMDPRLWPTALATLMEGGAADAWLTPILMKKGRPAHTLQVLSTPELVATLTDLIFRHTTTIGVRTYPVDRATLTREEVGVTVEGCTIRVKVARLHGHVVNAQPEFDDVLKAAAILDEAPRDILREAQLLAGEYVV